jgi:hypothetical protein
VIVLGPDGIEHSTVMRQLKETKWAADKEQDIEAGVPTLLIM